MMNVYVHVHVHSAHIIYIYIGTLVLVLCLVVVWQCQPLHVNMNTKQQRDHALTCSLHKLLVTLVAVRLRLVWAALLHTNVFGLLV